jgi:hypothetical protein
MTKPATKKPTKEEVQKTLKNLSESQIHALRSVVGRQEPYDYETKTVGVHRIYVNKGTMDALNRRGMFLNFGATQRFYIFRGLSPLANAVLKELERRADEEKQREEAQKEQERRGDKGREFRRELIKMARNELSKEMEKATEEVDKAKELVWKAADAVRKASTKLWSIQQQLYSLERCTLEEIALCHEKLGYADSEEEARKMYDPPKPEEKEE